MFAVAAMTKPADRDGVQRAGVAFGVPRVAAAILGPAFSTSNVNANVGVLSCLTPHP
jgi:hypothetical protein